MAYIAEKLGRTKKAVNQYRLRIGLQDSNPHRMSKIRASITEREKPQTPPHNADIGGED